MGANNSALNHNQTKEIEASKSKDGSNLVKMLWNINDKRDRSFEGQLVSIGDAKWYLGIWKSRENISVYLNCVRESAGQVCDTKYSIFFRSEKSVLFRIKGKHCFKGDRLSTNVSHINLTTWSFLFDRDNGFVDANGNVEICAEVNVRGFTPKREKVNHFSSSTPFYTDCVLILGEKEVHINKGLLSVYSPVFNNIFNSEEFQLEKNAEGTFSEELKSALEGISRSQFVQLLTVIYPSREPITDSNVEVLLKLASRFEMKDVLQHCVCHLTSWRTGFTVAKKLHLAQEYGLEDLKEMCIDRYHTLDDLKQLENNEIYKFLDKDIKIKLFERILKK
uniref:BTB domain-containing protein n=1 Tax=Ditylenchus dipsaci TaxID=166011 RepID=A0A915CZH5_9BILA